MLKRSLPLSELAGISRLAADYTYDFERVRSFYRFPPRAPSSYAEAAAAIQYPGERRSALVEALREQNPDNPLLDPLSQPGCVVVATGQQVGLFTGPAYTIYKALTAVRLAQRLTEQGIPAVPVFWMATEDHDFAEVNHCWVFDGDGRPVRIESTGPLGVSPAVGQIMIVADVAARLGMVLGGMAFAEEVVGAARQAYAHPSTFGGAFRALLERLVGAHRLLFLDPLRRAVRRLAAPILARAKEESPVLVAKLMDRTRQLEAAGYHAQVLVESSSSLLFHLENGRRLPLRRDDTESWQRIEPENLSPNALLRPVIQDYLMPTVATVMGPAEVAYMAQAEVIYRELLGRMPVVVNRASFTLADARSLKLMERYQFSLSSLARGEEEVRAEIARRLVPPELEGRLGKTTSSVRESLETLRAGIHSFDPTLAEALDKSRSKILYQLDKIGRKVGREALRRDQRTGAEAEHLCSLLYPERQMQERFYTILPFLAKHGWGLIDQVYRSIDLDNPDHQLLVS